MDDFIPRVVAELLQTSQTDDVPRAVQAPQPFAEYQLPAATDRSGKTAKMSDELKSPRSHLLRIFRYRHNTDICRRFRTPLAQSRPDDEITCGKKS
jgi:hypothetical protein